MSEQTENNTQAVDNAGLAFEQYTNIVSDSAKARKELNEKLKQSFLIFKQTTTNAITAINSTRGGLEKYNRTIDGVFDNLHGMNKAGGVMGGAISLLLSSLNGLITGATKLNDSMIKNYDILSNYGVNLDNTSEELMGFSSGMGLTRDNMQIFGETLAGIGGDLKLLGKTTGQATKLISEAFASSNEFLESFDRLGFGIEEVSSSFASYATYLGKSDSVDAKDATKLRKRSVEYMETLRQLSAMTGISADALQAELQQAHNDIRFKMYQTSLERSNNESDRNIAKENVTFMQLSSRFDETTKQGIMDFLVNGRATSKEAAQLQVLTDGKINEIIRKRRAGLITGAEAYQEISKAVLTGIDRYGDVLKHAQGASEALGVSAKTMDAAQVGASAKDLARLKKDEDSIKNGKTSDILKNNAAEIKKNERGLQQSRDKIQGEVLSGVSSAITTIISGISKFVDTFSFFISGEKLPMTESEPVTSAEIKVSSDFKKYLQSVAMVESSGDVKAKAKTSSASGLFQFTEDTWKDTVKKMGKNYSLEDRFDAQKSTEVMEYFTKQQKQQIERALGREANNADLYMAHFLGAGGASTFFAAMKRDPNALAETAVKENQLAANKTIFYDNGKPRTLQQVYNLMADKISRQEKNVEMGKVPDIVKNMTADVANLSPGAEKPQARVELPNAKEVPTTIEKKETPQKTAKLSKLREKALEACSAAEDYNACLQKTAQQAAA